MRLWVKVRHGAQPDIDGTTLPAQDQEKKIKMADYAHSVFTFIKFSGASQMGKVGPELSS